MRVGYARTSTRDQQAGFDAQLVELNDPARGACEKIFKEKVSSVAVRVELDAALEYVREGDALVVTKLDRLARSSQHLVEIVAKLKAKKVDLVILGMDLDTKTPTGAMMLTVLGAFAQFEREMILERQLDGIKAAKDAGEYLGRKPRARLHAREIIAMRDSGTAINAIAAHFGIDRTSVYRVLKRNDAASDLASCGKWLERQQRPLSERRKSRTKVAA